MLRILLSEARRYHRQRHHRSASCYSDDWSALQRQIEAAWDCSGLPVGERYLRLKYRLTTLFLWDREHDIVRDLDDPPTAIMNVFSREQQRRLETLPPGQLFHSPVPTDATPSPTSSERSELSDTPHPLGGGSCGMEASRHHAEYPRVALRWK